MKRRANFVGQFYPANRNKLKNVLKKFEAKAKQERGQKSIKQPLAAIVPHAGYIYSGSTATYAFNEVFHVEHDFENIVVVGPAHHTPIYGIQVSTHTFYETPLGELEVSQKLITKLLEKLPFLTICNGDVYEHSTEVQFPLIKYFSPNIKCIEIIYGQTPIANLFKLIEIILQKKRTILIVSSDLSHFYDQKMANKIDANTLSGIKNLNTKLLSSPKQGCGLKGVVALEQCAKQKNLKPHILDYKTSFESTGDSASVVGYCSAVFGKTGLNNEDFPSKRA